MQRMIKLLISVLLILCMCFSLTVTTAFAENESATESEETTEVQEKQTGTEEDEAPSETSREEKQPQSTEEQRLSESSKEEKSETKETSKRSEKKEQMKASSSVAGSGIHGDNEDWILDDEGTLTINSMREDVDDDYRPWYSYKESIKSVVIKEGVTFIRWNAFSGCSNLTSITIPDSIASIGESAFSGCSSLTNITIPNSVTFIDDGAFSGCSSLTNITIPDGVTRIGELGFSGCSKLTSVTIPDSVTIIEDRAFSGCSSLLSITIGNGIKYIGECTFYNCTSLTSITIPDSVKNIYYGAFSGCVTLKNVYYLGTKNEWNSIIIHADNECLTNATIYYSGSGDDIPVTSVTLDQTSVTLQEGEMITLTVTVSPKIATDQTVTWISSDSSVATVNNGKITAVKAGTATITAQTSNNKKAICKVTVKLKTTDITDISLNKTSTSLIVGESETLSVSITPSDTPDKTITWTSSDPSIATVDNGKITACHDGTTTITATTVNGLTAKCNVTVYTPATGSCGDNVTWTLDIDGTLTISGNGDMTSGSWNRDNIKKVIINNGVTSIATHAFQFCFNLKSVTISDSVTSIGYGAFDVCSGLTSITIPNGVTRIENWTFAECYSLTSVTIPESVTSIGYGAFCECDLNTVYYSGTDNQWKNVVKDSNNDPLSNALIITSDSVLPSSIAFEEGSISLERGNSITPVIVFKPSNTSIKTLNWTSSNQSVVYVNNGKITASNYGTATITAETINGLTAKCIVTVITPVSGILLDRESVTLEIGDTVSLTATIFPFTATDKTITWTSSNPSVATVDNGKITAIKAGTATIKAKTANGKEAACNVNVVIKASGISLNIESMSLALHGTSTVKATITPSDTTDKTVTWLSSNPSVATVDNGKITAVKAGTATITAETNNGKKATCKVTVIGLSDTSLTIYKGKTATLKTFGLTGKITWKTSKKSVATVSSKGKVTAKKKGTAYIYVYINGKKSKYQCKITVKNPALTVNVTKVSIKKGSTFQITATPTPAATVTYKTSNKKVATVSKAGLVKGVKKGTATITVKANGVTKKVKITVKN